MAAEVDHSSRDHALLSASGSPRWLVCTQSPKLEQKFAQSKTSTFAEEGTLAHEFGQLGIELGAEQISLKIYNAEVKKLKKHALYSSEMDSEVLKYTEYVLELFNIIKQSSPDAVLLVEQRLDFSHLVPRGFGTGDILIIADGKIYVIDLKYGKGIQVFAEKNSQLMLYGIGALRRFEMLYDIDTVVLTIVQPRLDHIDTWEISADDLIDWGETVVRTKAILAYNGEGELKAGSHCKFCRAKAMCRAFAEENLKLAKHDFKDPQLLSDDELLGIYEQMPMLQDWAKAITEHMIYAAIKGKKWPGYKVVHGRSNRKFTDTSAVIKVLAKSKFTNSQYLVTELASLTEIEKLLGKDEFEVKLKHLITKPVGAPTLALESDTRLAIGSIESAKKDFEN